MFNNNNISREIKRFQTQLDNKQSNSKTQRTVNSTSTNHLDSVQGKQSRVDLGENPFMEWPQRNLHDTFNRFDHLKVASEDEEQPIKIKVFNSSTKSKVESNRYSNGLFNAPKQKKTEILHDYRIIPPKGSSERQTPISKRTTPIIPETDLESKLFPERSPRNRSPLLESSTLLLNTSNIRKDYKPSNITIKLHRNPDKHFYEFIKEYGVILQPQQQSPSTERYSASTQQQSDQIFYNYELHSADQSRNSSQNRDFSPKQDSSIFSHYFQNKQLSMKPKSKQLPQSQSRKQLHHQDFKRLF